MATALDSKIKWGLTGTPVQNSEKDLYSLYSFLGIPKKFLNITCIEMLNKTILLRRTKTMVEDINKSLKMPTLYQKDYALEFSSEKERSLYKKIQDNVTQEYIDIIENEDLPEGQKMVAFFELLLRLRQASVHPQIVISGFQRKFKRKFKRYNDSSTKIDKLVEMIAKQQNKNSLIFCHFREEMDLLKKYLDKEGIDSEQYHGGMNHKERLTVLNKFPSNESRDLLKTVLKSKGINEDLEDKIFSYTPKVLLIQINAGGVGLNLQQFSEVYFTSPDWNPSNEIQALARAHRLGQDQPVTVHRFTLFDPQDEFSTIDQRIGSVQIRKRDIMAKILEDETLQRTAEFNYQSIKSKALIQKLSKDDYNTLLNA